jgi:Concanavalin A-like lectin/glucanases superfamily
MTSPFARSRVTLAVAALLAGSCGGSSTATGSGTGGVTGTGGARATGGVTGTGGATSTGGATGPGGATSTGGAAGAKATGGPGGSAGAMGTGGAAGAKATGGTGGLAANCASPTTYDQTVLCDQPVAYWAMKGTASTEADLVGGNTGTYRGAAPAAATLPNGDGAAHFNGSNGYLTIPSNAAFSLPTTGNLTWEGWINADTLQFPNASSDGYVDWMGKCADYSPTCEWEARMYSTTTSESPNRPNRMSAYIFNSSAGLGSAADWQAVDSLIKAGTWYYVVGEYTTKSAPSDCQNTSAYPGSINVWVNGVEWDQGQHGQTGCMSQYNVVPTADTSPLNIGTMAGDTWFSGAVGKVAIYDKLLSQVQVNAHWKAMTGNSPAGSCSDTCSF